MKNKNESRLRRKKRIRGKLAGTGDRPRLSVFRSARHIYAQVVNDADGSTLCAASTLSEKISGVHKVDAAKKVGESVARACIDKGIQAVVFDRNGFLFHGRIKALATGAREAGLKF